LANAPGNVLLKKRTSRLPKDSVVNVSQLFTLDQSFLSSSVGRLSREQMNRVDEGLRLVQGL
jgi:mRNA interferase MazF